MPEPTGDPQPNALAALERLNDDELRLLRRLITTLSSAPVVRTQRLEVVDDEGRVRVVIGNLAGEAEEGCFPGVSLRTEEGTPRAELVVTDDGPALTFSLAGHDVLVAGVDDPDLAMARGGPYVELLHHSAQVAAGWRLAGDEVLEWKAE
jgi:hypothetical protein